VEQTWSWTGRMVEGENRPFICLTFLEVKNPWLLIQAAAVWSNIYAFVRPPNICTWRWIRGDNLHPWASKTVPVLPIHVMQKWPWFYRARIASCYMFFIFRASRTDMLNEKARNKKKNIILTFQSLFYMIKGVLNKILFYFSFLKMLFLYIL
jgi:hypothetical protein